MSPGDRANIDRAIDRMHNRTAPMSAVWLLSTLKQALRALDAVTAERDAAVETLLRVQLAQGPTPLDLDMVPRSELAGWSPPLRWTSTPPTEPGIWWCRGRHHRPGVANVSRSDGGKMCANWLNAGPAQWAVDIVPGLEWAGPIPPPLDSNGEGTSEPLAPESKEPS